MIIPEPCVLVHMISDTSSFFKVWKVVDVSLSHVIARHKVPKQSRREEAVMRLLRFARNDMGVRIRYATF